MMRFYVLNANGEPVLEPDPGKFGEWFAASHSACVVKQDRIGSSIMVSTVFLGINHSCSKSGEPVLWETMIFGGHENGYQRRYTSKEAALAGHEEAVKLVKSSRLRKSKKE